MGQMTQSRAEGRRQQGAATSAACRPRVLVVNDDGIESVGLRRLVDALCRVAEVYVCAPDTQRSGASQSITLRNRIFVHEAEYPGAQGAMVVTGTPADCTKVGIQFFGERGVEFDLVYSGINLGSNLGCDTLYSGTVGAAMEGSLSGVRSIAISVDSHQATEFDEACRLAVEVMDFAMQEIGPDTILNINVPHLPPEQVKGVKVCVLGGRYYADGFVPHAEGGYYLEGTPKPGVAEGPNRDMDALAEGYATITPLQSDYTQYALMEKVARLGQM